MKCFHTVTVIILLLALAVGAEESSPPNGDQLLSRYFALETQRLEDDCLAGITSLEDWQARRGQLRQQLLEMLGLDPWPEKTDLQATITGQTEQEEFTVQRVHFQSRPGLYVTGNLYLPKQREGQIPAILYVCGHGLVVKDGISYGNKVHYQHHGAWYARNGYACLTIDTLQMGEIQGLHHGMYEQGMWWWQNRGYTPAGVEAWNCVRAIDYLQSRPEIDPDRIGVTGRSGGGAYSWWIAAIDDRIKVAVPVAGITDLRNHVVDGCVEGHCDCMYIQNTYRWDYPLVAALVAPRPLLISNTDRDRIFPLDGVVRVHAKVRSIYELYGKPENLALHITAGPHKDTQELQIHAFRWFNHFLRNDDSLIEKPAIPFFEPEQLQVFAGGELPSDEHNTRIHEEFVVAADVPRVPTDAADWQAMRERWMLALRNTVFGGWPKQDEPEDTRLIDEQSTAELKIEIYEFVAQDPFRLPLIILSRGRSQPAQHVDLYAVDETEWAEWNGLIHQVARNADAASPAYTKLSAVVEQEDHALAIVAVRGIGPTAWHGPDSREDVHIQRRFYLLGQTLDGMRVWDLRRAIRALKSLKRTDGASLKIHGKGRMAVIAAYASLFEDCVSDLVLDDLPMSHREGPFFFNIDRYVGMSAAMAMVNEHARIRTNTPAHPAIAYSTRVGSKLGWSTVERSEALATGTDSRPRLTENVILVTMDGLRWQELFTGADSRLLGRDSGGVRDEQDVKARFWHEDAEVRRSKLLPFFWQTVAREGQVFGDPDHGSSLRCSNGRNFSYPGYNEILCGFGDSSIDSNDKIPNKNVSVLEWLNRRAEFRGRVGAVASWDVFPFILNEQRSGLFVSAGWDDTQAAMQGRRGGWRAEFPVAAELPRMWPSVRYDVYTFHSAMEYLREHRPRVLYVGLGETDDWAHEGRYDLYLDAAARNDRYIEALWQTAQSLEEYRGRTSLIITTDHGRGDGRDGWKSHGTSYPGSDAMWAAVLGPDTPALGLRENVQGTQAQVAASLAELLGLDFAESDARIQPPLPGIVADQPIASQGRTNR
jgi:cephalosporin-C deacetylase-like acetyl esterase